MVRLGSSAFLRQKAMALLSAKMGNIDPRHRIARLDQQGLSRLHARQDLARLQHGKRAEKADSIQDSICRSGGAIVIHRCEESVVRHPLLASSTLANRFFNHRILCMTHAAAETRVDSRGASRLRFSFAGMIERFAPLSLRAPLGRRASQLDRLISSRDERAVTQKIALTAFGVRIVSALIAYASQVLLARWMGDFEYGVYVVVWVGAVIIGGLACFGIQTAIVRFIPEYSARNELNLLRGIIRGSRVQGLVSSTLIAGIGIAGIAYFGDRIASYYVMPLYLAAICIPMLAIGEIQDGIARGFNWPDLALWPTFIVRPILIIGLTWAAIRLGAVPDAVTAMVTAIIATYVTAIWQMIAIGRRSSRLVPGGVRHYRSMNWIAVALPIFLVEGFFNLLTNVDILIVGQLRPPEEVAVYFAAVKTLAIVHFVYFAVRAALMPRFSQYYAAGDTARFEAVVRDSLHWTFWPSLAAVVLLLACGRLLLSMFGESFVSGFPLLSIFAVGLLFRASIGPAESILTMAGEQRICAAVYAGTFVVNLILNYTLIPRLGLQGAAIATATALIVETCAVYLAVRWRMRLRCSIVHVLVRGSSIVVPRAASGPL